MNLWWNNFGSDNMSIVKEITMAALKKNWKF